MHRFHDLVFYLLVAALGLGAIVLGERQSIAVDTTREARNSLTPRSAAVIAQIDSEASVTLYSGYNPALQARSRDLLSRYQRANGHIRFEYVNTERDPSISRELNIQRNGELIVRFGEREKRLNELSEQALTDAFSSLLIAGERIAIFTSGHGERHPMGAANHDLGEFSARLQKMGYRIDAHESQQPLPTPAAGTLLIVASPNAPFDAAEQLALAEYINRGGNLLWLQDADGAAAVDNLRTLFGVGTLPGVIVDAQAQQLGLPSPDFAVTQNYPSHEALIGLNGTSLFPRAVALTTQPSSVWQASALFQSSAESWNETGDIAGDIKPDAHDEQPGPLPFALSLSRTDSNADQRIAIIGDGDFLANSWLGNGANVALGERLFSWMTQSQSAPLTPPASAPDRQVYISPQQLLMLGGALFGAIPLLMLAIGGWQWRRQRT